MSGQFVSLMPKKSVVSCLLTIALAAPLLARQAAPQTEAEKLNALISEYAAARTAAAPGRAGGAPLGRALVFDRGPGGSPEQTQAAADAAAAFAKKLATIKPLELSHQDWLTYALTKFDADRDAETPAFWLAFHLAPYSSTLRSLTTPFTSFEFLTASDVLKYGIALRALPDTMKAYETRLQQQMDRGIVLPADELKLVLPFIRTFALEPPASAFSVSDARLAALDAASKTGFQNDVDATIRAVVNPAIEHLAQFVDGPYRAKAPAEVGLRQYPGGLDDYRRRIRLYTGLDLTPGQIHEIGLKEVARLGGELENVRKQAGFTGTLAEFRKFLKTDQRFFGKQPQDIGDAMMTAMHRIEPRVSEFFLKIPKAPYGVLRLDAALEPSMTYGYYQIPARGEPRGLYRFNGSHPEQRSLLMAAAIIYHELVPGHHFQIALNSENAAPTGVRRTMYTAYTEGWGEYASDLAAEMGGYPDPYSRAGRLGMDLFLSSRLVVDTGMNALGWSRVKAMQYMKDNILESDLQIDSETLRYSSDNFGQALAYKLGTLTFHELRDTVKAKQGAGFDIRRFHDYVLDYGSMPLGVLEQHVDCLVGGEKHKGK